MNCEIDDKSFIFVWKVVNWRMRCFYTSTFSPKFIIKRFLNTTWILNIDLNNIMGKFNYCYIQRHIDSEGPDEVEVEFSIFVSQDPLYLPKNKQRQTKAFKKGTFYTIYSLSIDNYQKLIPYDDSIYIICHMSMKADVLEKDTANNADVMIPGFSNFVSNAPEYSKLILEHVHEDLQMLQKQMFYFPNKLLAQTLTVTEKRTFVWSLKDILNKRQMKVIASVLNIPDISIVLHKNKENAVQVKVQPRNTSCFTYSICNAYILDFEENILCGKESKKFFYALSSEEQSFGIAFSNSSENQPTFDISANYFLRLDISISKGETVSWIESTSTADFTNLEVAKHNPASELLANTMKDVNADKRFSDVTLQLPGRKFEVHKAILCANSSVFSAMFENNMKESETNFVDIDDIDEHIMERMLIYMYGDVLEGMQHEEAMKLYEAADKYQILPLQKKCAMHLKTQLTPKNALHILCLSDAHADEELKSHASIFVVAHIKEILSFEEEWDIFSKNNMLLENEILKKVCFKLIGVQINHN